MGVNLTPPLVFPKMCFSKKGWNPVVFFYIYIYYRKLHLFLKNSLKFLKSFRSYEDYILQYCLFVSIFRTFWHFLVTKKVMMSAYNRFFYFQSSLNRFFNSCVKLYWYSISFSWNINGWSNWAPPQKKLPSKSPALLGISKPEVFSSRFVGACMTILWVGGVDGYMKNTDK